jgi:predicted ATPase
VVAACIGKTFDLGLLASVLGEPEAAALTHLAGAIQDELLLPTVDRPGERLFRFAHDRIQQSAHALRGATSRAAVHLEVGRRLLERVGAEEIDADIFSIVDQLNHGFELVVGLDQRLQYAGLNLRASHRAKSAMAYQAARSYYGIGVGLLPVDI